MSEKRAGVYVKTGKQRVKNMEDKYPRLQARMDCLRAAEKKAEMLRERRDILRLLTTDTSAHLMRISRSPSPDQQKILTALAELDEVEQELTIAEQSVQALRLELAELFCRVTNPSQKKVLLMYYIKHRSWKTIARETHNTLRNVFRYRCAGLEELEMLLKAEEEKAG